MKTTQEMIDVMQAYVAGKLIQYRSHYCGEWHDCANAPPCWEWPHNDYRVKPREPRQWCIEIDSDTNKALGVYGNVMRKERVIVQEVL